MDNGSDCPGKETERISADELQISRSAEVMRRGLALLVYHRDMVRFVPLAQGRPVVVGRDPAPGPFSVAIGDPSLSREHAKFSVVGDAVEVRDLGSKNGTWHLGERIARAELGPGDEIRLSGVPVVVQGEPRPGVVRRPLSHEGFRLALEDEVVRARHFKRPFALVMIRAESGAARHVSGFHAHVSEQLRPVDRIAFYSSDTLELLLSEAGLEEARRLVEAVVLSGRGRQLGLIAGVATFPDSAPEPEALLDECRKALVSQDQGRVRLARAYDPRARGPVAQEGIIVTGAALRKVLDQVDALARSNLPVLMFGETGVGKEILAHRIHTQSGRRARPLVIVNCAAIPETLVEGTLFGHQRGAFTGAIQQQKGLFEAADGGTLMLDEIGDLPRSSQAALLRVLESGRVRRVGATDEIDVDVRILAATHRDLEAMCEKGEFREDLFYRLRGDTVTIPPLRDRPEEIEPLAVSFLKRANEANGRSIARIDPRAMALLVAYPWPGNVRELRNAIERAVVLAQGDSIMPEDLPERVAAARPPAPATVPPAPPSPPGSGSPSSPRAEPSRRLGDDIEGDSLREKVARFEAHLIMEAIKKCGGNQRAAAEFLGLPLRTLVHKISARGIKIKRAPYVEPEQPGPSKRSRKRG